MSKNHIIIQKYNYRSYLKSMKHIIMQKYNYRSYLISMKHIIMQKYIGVTSCLRSNYCVSQLGSQNQDLMGQNLMLKEQMIQFELNTTDDYSRLQRRFMAELGLCFSELQSLVQICLQRARGEDPNMSVLLGVKGKCSCRLFDIFFKGDFCWVDVFFF